MSDKSGFISELAGGLGQTAGDIVKGTLTVPGQFIEKAAEQAGLPVAQRYKDAAEAVKPRIRDLTTELKSFQTQRHTQQELNPTHQERKTIETPGRRPHLNILERLKRADRKESKQASA